MLTLILNDTSLYCAQWDRQNGKSVLFQFVKAQFHSSIMSCGHKTNELTTTLKTALQQLSNLNLLEETHVHIILDISLTSKSEIEFGTLSDIKDIESYLTWCLKKRWGQHINNTSFSLLRNDASFYCFSLSRELHSCFNNILNEYGVIEVTYQPMETLFKSTDDENGVIFDLKTKQFLIYFNYENIHSCMITKRKNSHEYSHILGNEKFIRQTIKDKNMVLFNPDNIKFESQSYIKNSLVTHTPFEKIVTESVTISKDIPDRIQISMNNSIIQSTDSTPINYFSNPFISIVNHWNNDDSIRSLNKESDSHITNQNSDVIPNDSTSKWIIFLIISILGIMILLKNNNFEGWIKNFRIDTNQPQDIPTQTNSELPQIRIEPYVEYNHSQTILNSLIFLLESHKSYDIININCTDLIATIITSSDTLYPLFSSLGLIRSMKETNINQYQTDLDLVSDIITPISQFKTVNEIINYFDVDSSLKSYRKLEKRSTEKFSYSPLILHFSSEGSLVQILEKIKDLGGNIVVRKIEVLPSKIMDSMTIYISVLDLKQT